MQRITSNNVIEFLQSQAATLALLALALAAQMPHAASVFNRIKPEHSQEWYINVMAWSLAIFYAVALEMAILKFVVNGNRKAAYSFAVVSVLINVAYYQIWLHFQLSIDAIANIATMILISLALPGAIAWYSHSVAKSLESAQTSSTTPQKRPTVSSNAKTPEQAQTSSTGPQGKPGRKRKQPAITKKAKAQQMFAEGMSQADIATQLGVNPSTVYRAIKEVEHTHVASTATQQNGDGNG